MSLIEVDDVEALMSPGLESVALQDLIDREEDWLANDATVGIGQLVGVRTQTVWVLPGEADPILLQRPTDAAGGQGSGGELEVLDNGGARTDIALTGPARIEGITGGWTGPQVAITYAPTDTARVKRVLLELIRLSLSSSPYAQEATEGRSYSRGTNIEAQRMRLARSLNPHRGVRTVHLGTGESHRMTS